MSGSLLVDWVHGGAPFITSFVVFSSIHQAKSNIELLQYPYIAVPTRPHFSENPPACEHTQKSLSFEHYEIVVADASVPEYLPR